MLSSHLEDRFREQLGEAVKGREESVRFGVEFTRLLARIVPDEAPAEATAVMRAAIAARTDLSNEEIDLLLEMAMAPENRAGIVDDELRAYGARFGRNEEEALRAAVAEEINLAAYAERYGSAEALLLLDALFAVCAVDGVIDRSEIGRLQRSAAELGIDPMLVGALFRKYDARHASGDFSFELSGDRYTIGRANSAHVQLPDPQVALRHAELFRSNDSWRIVDLGSGRPTLVNGSPVSSAPFRHGDQLRVGPYTLSVDREGKNLTAFGTKAFSALSVRNLKRKVGETTLLDGVSFTVFSGEVIALVGPSGAGKTTLLTAIAGIAPPDSGDVLLDGQNFHTLLSNDRSMVGIVPQDDVIHGELTVEEGLFFAGRLRFPSDVDKAAIGKEVDRVLDELGIEHIRKSRIGSALKRGISGGQRKRVNLGQELLTRTTRVLFLDEPTSGLDPQTAQEIVSLVRQLADDGRIVFLVTHDVSPSILAMVDHLIVLAPGGRLAWFGPPDEAATWFGVESVDEIFARLPDQPPTAWGERYRGGAAYRKFVRTREHLLGLDGVAPTAAVGVVRARRSRWLQYLTLTRRYARVKIRDWAGTGVLLSQAPILGIAMCVVFPEVDTATLFVLVLSVLWFGASGSVRELISERHIWRREARVGLGVLPYMASKVTVLGALSMVQAVSLTTILYVWMSLGSHGYSWFALSGVTIATAFVGMAMGLVMSAMFSSSEAAVGTLPLVLIPQITFGGLIVKLKDMPWIAKIVAYAMITRYSFEWSIKTGVELNKPERKGVGSSFENISRFLWELGFRGTDADDMGLPGHWIFAILALFFTVFLGLATYFTARSREGN